jgi:ABC-2 type transport system permease protein
VPGLEWLAWLMPFHYYSVSKPLVAGYGMQWGAWSVLVMANVVLIILASLIFIRRDIGSVFKLSNKEGKVPGVARTRTRSSTWLLGSVFGKSIRDLILPTLFWSAGLAFYGVLIVSTTNQVLEPLREIIKNLGVLAQIMGNLATPESYISIGLVAYLPVLLAVFSITQIISWAEDEEEGRLEVLASEPLPRIQLLLGRYLAIVLALAAILAITGVALLLAAAGASVNLNSARLIGSLVAVILPAFAVAAFGLCVATWLKRPGAAIPLTVGVVTVMFFLDALGPILNLPEAVLNISVFHLYGRPLTEGLMWGGIMALAVASVVLLVGSLVGLNRRDIVK